MDSKTNRNQMGRIEQVRQYIGNNMEPITKVITDLKEQYKIPYYVPYSVNYLDSGYEINIYAENKETKQLALKYFVPGRNGLEDKKETIILATNTKPHIDVHATKTSLNQYFDLAKMYKTQMEIEPEKCVAKLESLGWDISEEGLDVFSTARIDQVQELQRTQFTTRAQEEITPEVLEKRQEEHYYRMEMKKINLMSDYIKSAYQQVTNDDLKEIRRIQGKSNTKVETLRKRTNMVREYAKQNQDIDLSDNELAQIFTNIKPILLSEHTAKKEASLYIQKIRNYIETIPAKYQNEEIQEEIFGYLIMRLEIAISRDELEEKREDKESVESLKEVKQLKRYLQQEEKQEKVKRETKRKELGKKAEKILPDLMRKQSEIERM